MQILSETWITSLKELTFQNHKYIFIITPELNVYFVKYGKNQDLMPAIRPKRLMNNSLQEVPLR